MRLEIGEPTGPIIALGAHADDIEIGAGGLLTTLESRFGDVEAVFIVFTGGPDRRSEAEHSASALLGPRVDVAWLGAEDGYLPYVAPAEAKRFLADAVRGVQPWLVLSPGLDDAHQDHRFVAQLAWQVLRGAWILEYEVPKWESDRPVPNLYVPLSEQAVESKLAHLAAHFPSQHAKGWYRRSTFEASMRLRGVECGAPHAEAFTARKVVVG